MAERWLSFIGSGSKVSGGTTGTVEVYHALRFLQGGEPLRAPLTIVVGDLVADFVADQCHGSFEMLWGGGSVTSRLRGKGSGGIALRLSPCEHSMARQRG
jgi:hypothetical protein